MKRERMLKKILVLVLCMAVALTDIPLGSFRAEAAYAGEETAVTLRGEGTTESPYLIATEEELIAFRTKVNAVAAETDAARTACAKLEADIEVTEANWTPISNMSAIASQYGGTFDGDGHTVNGIKLNVVVANQGFFGGVNGAVIKNLKVNGNIESTKSYIGGIVGKVQAATIENCMFDGSVISTNSSGYAGGIVGGFNTEGNKVEGCVNKGTIEGYCAGGILGYSKYSNSISNCYNVGTIKGSYRAAGIAGQLSSGSIKNCFNVGAIEKTADAASLGGIFSFSNADVVNCYFTLPAENVSLGGTAANAGEHKDSMIGMADALGEAFAEGEEHPVLAWQTDEIVTSGKATVVFAGVLATDVLTISKSGSTSERKVENASIELTEGDYNYKLKREGYKLVTGSFTVTEEEASTAAIVNYEFDAESFVELESLRVSGYAEQYFVGDELTGLVVTAVYADASEETVTAYTTDWDSSAEAAEKTVTVSFEGKTATFTTSIVKKEGVLSAIAGKTEITLVDGSYGFEEKTTEGYLASNNQAKNSSKAKMTIKALESGMLSFSYKVSSEAKYDYLHADKNGSNFVGNSSNKALTSGTIDWTSASVLVAAGDVVSIYYEKDSSGNNGEDTAYLKDFAFAPAYTIKITVTPAEAKVVLKDSEGTEIAGTAGNYVVVPGVYKYTASCFGYETSEGTLIVTDSDLEEAISLNKAAGKKVSFNITLPENITEAATVEVKSGAMVIAPEADGSYSLPAGSYTYSVKHAYCDEATGEFEVAGEDVVVNVTLQRKLVAEDVAAVAGATFANDATYPYVAAGSIGAADNELRSTNIKGNTSEITFTAQGNIKLSFSYNMKMEDNSTVYNWMQFYKNDEAVTGQLSNKASGWVDCQYDLKAGDVLKIKYKSSTYSSNAEKEYVAFRNFTVEQVYTLSFTGVPEGAKIKLTKGEKSYEPANGIFIVENGTYSYEISLLGYQTVSGEVVVDGADVVKPIEMAETARQTVTFSVTKPAEVEGEVRIEVTHEGVKFGPSEDGSFRLADAVYEYAVSCEGCDAVTGTFEVAGAAQTVSVVLFRTLTLADFIDTTYVTASNDTTYPFKGVYVDGEKAYLESTVNVNYKTAKITLQFNKAAEFGFDYATSLSTVSSYGFSVKNGSKEVLPKVYGENSQWKHFSTNVKEGDTLTIELYYYGGYGASARDDYYVRMRSFTVAPQYTLEFDVPEGSIVVIDGQSQSETNKYTLQNGAYSYTVKKFGYEDVKGSVSIENADAKVVVALADMVKLDSRKLAFSVEPSDASIVVEHEVGGVLTPSEDGSYSLPIGLSYKYTVSRADYLSKSGSVVLDADKTISVSLVYAGEAWDGTTKTEPVLENGVYLIANAAQLAWFADKVAEDNTVSAKLTAPINLNGKNWKSMGKRNDATYADEYKGTFDGNGKTIIGLVGEGLFYTITPEGVVKNVIADVKLSGSSMIGGIAKINNGTIENCMVTGTVTGSGSSGTGGICGRSQNAASVIRNCVNYAEIKNTTVSYAQNLCTGGITGYTYGTIENCYSFGNVSADSAKTTNKALGGLVGVAYNGSTVKNSYFAGKVEGPEAGTFGFAGNTGSATGTFENCYVIVSAGGNKTAGVEERTADQMREDAFVSALNVGGVYFHKDAEGINDGMPVLVWQGGTAVYDPSAEDVALDKAALSVEPLEIRTATQLALTVVGANGSSIVWSSSNPDVISNAGNVVLPTEGKAEVVLTATISKGSASDTKQFTLTVWSIKALNEVELHRIVEASALRSVWAQEILYEDETNITDSVIRAISNAGFDTEGLEVSLVSAGTKTMPASDPTVNIASNGAITYFTGSEGSSSGKYAYYTDVVFSIKKGGVEVTYSPQVYVSWSKSYVQNVLNTAAQSITWDSIKGSRTNETFTEDTGDEGIANILDMVDGYVEGTLKLPAQIGACSVNWTVYDGSMQVSNSATVDETFDGSTRYYECKIANEKADAPLVLYGSLTFNLLNDKEDVYTIGGIDYPTMFAYRGFMIVVPAQSAEEKIDEELTAQNLEKNFEALIKDSTVKTREISLDAVDADLQMPTPSDLEKAGILLKRSEERVTYTSKDESVLKFTGYAGNVFRPLVGEQPKTATYTVTITNRTTGELIAERDFSITVVPFTEAELAKAAADMKLVANDAVFWEGITAGTANTKSAVVENFKTFAKVRVNADGTYSFENLTASGFDAIVLDDIPGYDPMGSQPWRTLRSSNEMILTSETLFLTAPEYNTPVKVDAVFTYTKYAKYWQKALEQNSSEMKTRYAAFEQFYKVPVSAVFTVKGTRGSENPVPEPVETTVYSSIRGLGAFRNLYGHSLTVPSYQSVTAWDVVRDMLVSNGYSYQGGGMYISAITDSNGHTLGEFDYGENSGWLFSVNGEYPNYSLAQTYLKNGDSVEMVYTGDYKEEPGLVIPDISELPTASDGQEQGGEQSGSEEKKDEEPEIIELGEIKVPASAVAIVEGTDTDTVVAAGSPKEAAAAGSKKSGKFFDEDGKLMSETFAISPAGYTVYVGEDGSSVKNSLIVVGNTETGKRDVYYANKNGVIVKDKVVTLSDGSRIYLDETGKLTKNTLVTAKNGRTYYAGSDGLIVKDRVVKVNGEKYFANKYGVIVKNKKVVTASGKIYYADEDGKLSKKKVTK